MLEAALQDPIVIRLYDYWRSKAALRFAPSRSDIDPVEFAFALRDVVLVEVLAGEVSGFRHRVVGGGIAEHCGYDLTGKLLDEAPDPERRERLRAMWRAAVDDHSPSHAIYTAMKEGRPLLYESLALPLSSDGAAVDMLLGVERRLADR